MRINEVYNPEVRANRFASDVLLPVNMFVPRAKGRPMTLETVGDLAAQLIDIAEEEEVRANRRSDRRDDK